METYKFSSQLHTLQAKRFTQNPCNPANNHYEIILLFGKPGEMHIEDEVTI